MAQCKCLEPISTIQLLAMLAAYEYLKDHIDGRRILKEELG